MRLWGVIFKQCVAHNVEGLLGKLDQELNCPLMHTKNETHCNQLVRNGSLHFHTEKVEERLQYPSATYFTQMSTFLSQNVICYKIELDITIACCTLQNNAQEMEVQLAFSITTHGNLGILEAQLATLFHPGNAYCIYIDAKAPEGF